MGSAITVMLSFTRYFNIALVTTLAIYKISKPREKYKLLFPSIIIFILFILILILLFSRTIKLDDNYNIFNYYSTPLPYIVEIMLPLIILPLLYMNNRDDYGLFLLASIYILSMYGALFPPKNSFDYVAAKNVLNSLFSY